MDSDTSEYQYLSSFFKDGLYIGINNEDELANYAYNELFYISLFNYRNAAFNIKMNKFNIYRLSFTKIPILNTHIYKSDLSRVIYSDIEASPNKVIQILNIYLKAQLLIYFDSKRL